MEPKSFFFQKEFPKQFLGFLCKFALKWCVCVHTFFGQTQMTHMGYSSRYIELYPIVPDCIKSYPHLESHISSNYDHNILIQNSLISRYHLIPAAEAGHQFKALTPSDRRSYGLAQRSGGRSEGLSNDLDALGYPHFTKPPYGVDLTVSSGSKTFGLQLYWLYWIPFFHM